jgi:SNF2 family DNA or RNA helicase
MKILHGTWIPDSDEGFGQAGGFYLWAETIDPPKPRPKAAGRHPFQLPKDELNKFLEEELRLQNGSYRKLDDGISPKYFLLPSTPTQPLPSAELARFQEADLPETVEWRYWEVDCYAVKTIVKAGQSFAPAINAIKLLNDLHFVALHQLADLQMGADLLFWYRYTQTFKQVLLKDRYIPAFKYRQLPPPKATKSKRKAPLESPFELYPCWEIVSEEYEADIQRYVDFMPPACTCGFTAPSKSFELWDRETLLRHFSEVVLNDIVTHTPTPQQFVNRIADTLLFGCLHPKISGVPWTDQKSLAEYRQWQTWRQKIFRSQTANSFDLCFQLHDPLEADSPWQLQLLAGDRHDLSLRLPLADYWRMGSKQRKTLQKQYGADFEQQLLVHLGYAARIYPPLWAGLETAEPTGMSLDLTAAFEFLKESAWVLEDAGYKVIVPAWWTPAGRRRAKMKLLPSRQSSKGSSKASKSYFSADQLVQYDYQLAIGDESVSETEWQQLVQAKSPLVMFRGQWVELDRDKMLEMLEFWRSQQDAAADTSLLDLMKWQAQQDDEFELDFERDRVLSDLLAKLQDTNQLEVLPNPEQLQGTLREYQQRGLSWLNYLETLGLNGCLADDMGLGKTIQVIARLVHERESGRTVAPTLLVVPTSVLGNWQKEIEKFAPHLRTTIHHGGQRSSDAKDFKALCQAHDVTITSFTLARKDQKLFASVEWQRIVLDEAQNIKNPKAAQTKAILKLSARHRLALTGTPVENRLMDLWSIFNFLNPGYLGSESQFRKSFELPIQKNNDRHQSSTLKKLVEPFILRRVKTDRAIIKDLPDKVEQKVYCNLTKEQASLYEAVAKQVTEEIESAEGIGRKGLILATLMKLKQICNHPMQFLHDGSEFSPERSHKLSRLSEMVEEVMAEGESLLIFTQFTEIGEALNRYLRQNYQYNTYYLHGGTSRKKREQFITEFQDPETEPAAFVLSLKAGGVGITLTKANHVFHFDRWWNPAVEDQATDRAFRIGQSKNVFVHKFVSIGTLEERIDATIEDKKKLAGAIVGSDESWLTELDNEAFKQLISLNQAAVL